MRSKLQNIGEKERHTFTGEFERFGQKPAYKGSIPDVTVLLLNVKDKDGNIVTDHLWFNYTNGFRACDLKAGDIVQFDARVKAYEKGYKGYRDIEAEIMHPVSWDYKLSYPTNITVIERVDNSFVSEAN